MTKQQLIDMRTRLEFEHVGKRSMLDSIIDAWEDQQPRMEIAASVTPVAAEADHQKRETRQATRSSKRQAQQPAPIGIAGALRRWIATQNGHEFGISEAGASIGGTKSALSCAINKLCKAGLAERTGFGRYKATAKFETTETTAERYARERAAMDIKPVPDIEGARPASR